MHTPRKRDGKNDVRFFPDDRCPMQARQFFDSKLSVWVHGSLRSPLEALRPHLPYHQARNSTEAAGTPLTVAVAGESLLLLKFEKQGSSSRNRVLFPNRHLILHTVSTGRHQTFACNARNSLGNGK